ncbi:MAG TPA: ATP-binding protein [Candidatus Methylomirabilis sp.]|nr:ATP-binding protein [Candidatus Methylomirabilis sp.]
MAQRGPSSPRRLVPTGLRARLLWLVCLAVVPSLGLTLYTAYEGRRAAAEDLQANLLRMTQLVSGDHRSLVEGVHHLLIGLAQLREVRDRDPACNPIVAELQQHDPMYANLGAASPDGTLFCSAVSGKGRVSVRDQTYFTRAVQTRDFAAGEYQVGRGGGKPTINFAYPVIDQHGQLRAVLLAAVDLTWLSHLLERPTWPAGAVVTVFDANGTILARHPDGARWVGLAGQDEPAFRAIRAGRPEGTLEEPGPDGSPQLVAFASLGGVAPLSPVYYALSLSKAAAFEGIDRALQFNLAALAMVALLGLLAAWGIGEISVLRRVRALVVTARRLASGDLAARSGLPYGGELGELAGAVDEMAATLAAREAEAARAQAEILRQREALHQTEKTAGLGSLLASVAHELNNPLSVVLGRARLLRQLAGSGPMAPHAEKIDHAAERCARIVRNFLALARRHAPAGQLTGLNRVVGEALDLAADALRVDGVEVSLEVDSELPLTWADPYQLRQMVTNLVARAQHAMKEAPLPRRLRLRTSHDADRIVLEIADTGPAMAPELLARVFDPFFTAKSPSDDVNLGLALCRGIVESHRGTIQVESAPGEGTRFVVALPIGSPAGSPVTADPAGPPIRCRRVLLVEDEPDVSAILVDLLRLDGHMVEAVGNGLTAVERLVRHDYDLVLCDMQPLDLTGAGLYREATERRPELRSRFVFLTEDVVSADMAAFLGETGAPTIAKPFDVADVRRVIQRVLGSGARRPGWSDAEARPVLPPPAAASAAVR